MRKVCSAFCLVSVLGSATVCFAIVLVDDHGNWPEDWPNELEPLRASSRTLGVLTGIKETVYEIPVPDRETFERIWPAIVAVRTPGSPLRLSRFDPAIKDGSLFSNNHPTVRIFAPSNAVSGVKGDLPLPKEIVGSNGELPEYVIRKNDEEGQSHWVLPESGQSPSSRFRARIDLELVVDGQIIDLNRIALPDVATIIDRRFPQKEEHSDQAK
jgi:hypothetical protein